MPDAEAGARESLMVIEGASACKEFPGQNARILSWNVNGLRALASRCAAAKTTLAAELESLDADIICLQEVGVE